MDARRRDVPGVRWVRPETLHITLKFCGEIQEDMAEGMARHLAGVKQKGSFNLSIRGIGAFPLLTAPRTVYSGVVGDIKRLKEVRCDVETAALRVGLDRDTRSYNPHITLGRRNSNEKFPEEHKRIIEDNPIQIEPWRVETITLMKSDLFPEGPQYTPLGVFKI